MWKGQDYSDKMLAIYVYILSSNSKVEKEVEKNLEEEKIMPSNYFVK